MADDENVIPTDDDQEPDQEPDQGPDQEQINVTRFGDPPQARLADFRQFGQVSVRNLNGGDFNLDTPARITAKEKSCMLILLYVNNDESIDAMRIFGTAAQQAAGPIFAAVNLLINRNVATAFTDVRSSSSHQYYWAGMRGVPVILSYQNGAPVGAYNGSMSVSALVEFALTLACTAGYHEPIQVSAGQQVRNNIQMGTPVNYLDLGDQRVVRRSSAEFVTTPYGIRGFNPEVGVTQVGSEATQTELQREQAGQRTEAGQEEVLGGEETGLGEEEIEEGAEVTETPPPRT